MPVALPAILSAFSLVVIAVEAPSLDKSLTKTDRLAIETRLGQGSLGQPLTVPIIDAPVHWLPANPGTQLFNVIRGSDVGSQESVEWLLAAKPGEKTGWQYRFGQEEVLHLGTQPDGSLVIAGVEDRPAESVTRYDPPEPFLLKNLAPGEHRQTRMVVKVLSSRDPKEVTHQGELQANYEYLGAYRLTLPAGTFDTVVTKSTFSGNVGPAKIEDIQYRFFARKVGLVATLENRQVSAVLLYQSNTSIAKVLSQSSH